MTVGERIKEIRNKLGMSQVSFADKLDVSKQTLYKYENNIITNIPSDKIEVVAKLGNVSPAFIMGWEAEASAPTTLAAHLEGEGYTPEQIDRIEAFARFVKSDIK